MAMPAWEKYLGMPLLRVHDTVYRKSKGRIGHHIPFGPPCLLLHTVGAKTGQPRVNALSYARDGDDYLVVASKGGDPRAPGWFHNLKKNPQVEINAGPTRIPVTARAVFPDDPDFPRLWGIANNMRGNKDRYVAYQKRTSRPIPVIVLTPR